MAQLNENECEIVERIRDGEYPDDIAEDMNISRYTMRNKLRMIAFKLTGNERGARASQLPSLVEEQGACDPVPGAAA
jgi:DNA-binding CsgD family transcriptional regulator